MTIRTIEGKLLRSGMPSVTIRNTEENDNTPYRNTKIEVWDRDFLVDDQIGTAVTDEEGYFTLTYDTDDTGNEPDLLIKVFRLNAKGESELIFDQDGEINVVGNYNFGEIRIYDWEYDGQYSVPLIRTPDAGINASPQDFSASQTRKIVSAGLNFGAKRLIADQLQNIQQVQNIFPKNFTLENKDLSRTDTFFVDAVLNGFAPALFTKDDENKFHVRYSIDEYKWDGKQQAPNVHLILNEDLTPVKIEWSIRDKSSSTVVKSGSASPNDNISEWNQAKEYFRIAEFIDGEIKGHLGRSHINVGQYAIALYRNLQKSPIFKLLHPHLKEVSAINSFGKGIIFGAEGILSTSPLTEDGVLSALKDDLGKCNWKEWSPRKVVNDKHSYAKVNNLFWDILTEYIDDFFLMYERKILLDWKEIYYFSKDLVEHSVPFTDTNLVSGEKWYCNREISANPETGFAISGITDLRVNLDPNSQDIKNLKQVCAYAIYHATIWHDWRNDNQAKYAGEIDYVRLSLNYEVKDASFQLFIMNILSSVKYGYIVKNEDDDIPAMFISKLKSRIQEFKDIKDFENNGYDLRDLRSRINI
jgi:Lipoxygenase/Transthyretin-like family